MLNRILPRQFDNTYRGYSLALWLFGFVAAIKTLMGFNVSGLNPWISNRYVLMSADGIPVDSYGAEAGSVVTFMFASWGLELLLLSLLSLLVLVRYRAMVPLMLLILLLEQLGRKAIATISPIIHAAEPQNTSVAPLINWAFTGVLLIAFLMSITRPRSQAQGPSD